MCKFDFGLEGEGQDLVLGLKIACTWSFEVESGNFVETLVRIKGYH